MKNHKKNMLRGVVLSLTLLMFTLVPTLLYAGTIDWHKVRRLQGEAFLEYVSSLDLKGQQAIDFWKKIPLSRANKQVSNLFRKEAFAIYMKKYPRPGLKRVEAFVAGTGQDITGPISGQKLKLPFTSLYPLADGPIGDPNRTYRVAYTIHGLSHPWLLNNADSAQWQADRHPNVALTVLDPEFDNDKQAAQIDALIEQKVDGILVWPMQEAPTGPPVDRASKAGIPTVSVDRLVGSRAVRAQVTGNFPANGAQQGLYLVHRLRQETGKVAGKIVMIRKPHGSTADSMRTGHFLKVISYFPDIQILESHHNSSNRAVSKQQVAAVLEKYPHIDAIFCTGAEQSMGAVAAVDEAKRWHSRTEGRRMIILNNDDLFEALKAVEEDKIAMTAPYTPLLGALGLRVLLKTIIGEPIPKNVTSPDLPMVTHQGENIFGIPTIPVKTWVPYSYGRR
ncbi:sugar ABC transporter substrate-binding protein [Magnetococcus sp. PR-3]|uniref:sugar ABC transporter substrate-binding protein n=1 Tax=Magnetococcus sp. PR-3 TaxID=3120355 RepID=UPI002FCE3355